MSSPRDTHRAAVYAAEDVVAALLTRGGVVDFHGSRLDVPQQRRFGDLGAVQRYLDSVRACSWGAPDTPRPTVRSRRGQTKAHWSAPAEIAVPVESEWAMTELVVLHEYAHHINWHERGRTDHGPDFCGQMQQLVKGALGDAASLILLGAYHQSGALTDSVQARRGGGVPP